MNGRMYSLIFDNQTIATASGDYDLFEIDPATDKPVCLHALHLGQTSELGDAAEEGLRIAIIRGHTSTGNGTATTPRPMLTGAPAFAGVGEVIATTIASAGTGVTLYEFVWNVRLPFDYIFTPEMRPWTSGADLIVVRLLSTVTDDIVASGTLVFEELG